MQGFKTQRGAIIIEQTETTRPEPHRGEIIIEQREIAQNKPQRGDILKSIAISANLYHKLV